MLKNRVEKTKQTTNQYKMNYNNYFPVLILLNINE